MLLLEAPYSKSMSQLIYVSDVGAVKVGFFLSLFSIVTLGLRLGVGVVAM